MAPIESHKTLELAGATLRSFPDKQITVTEVRNNTNASHKVDCGVCLDRGWMPTPGYLYKAGLREIDPCCACMRIELHRDVLKRECDWCIPRRIAASIAGEKMTKYGSGWCDKCLGKGTF